MTFENVLPLMVSAIVEGCVEQHGKCHCGGLRGTTKYIDGGAPAVLALSPDSPVRSHASSHSLNLASSGILAALFSLFCICVSSCPLASLPVASPLAPALWALAQRLP